MAHLQVFEERKAAVSFCVVAVMELMLGHTNAPQLSCQHEG